MKNFLMLAIAAALLVPAPAQAQQRVAQVPAPAQAQQRVAQVPAQAQAQQRVDLAAFKCKEFLAANKDSIGLILMWLEGYYSEEGASPIVDFEKMRGHGSKLDDDCLRNPTHSLINAAEVVMSK